MKCGLALAFLSGALAFAQDTKPAAASARGESNVVVLELTGKVLPFKAPAARASFKTESGAIYTLLSNRMSSALFIDTNLQSKPLLLGGHVVPGSSTFEVTRNLRSIRKGKVQELYYYCDVCAIKASEPGPCMCCREPLVLVEEPEGKSKFQKPNRLQAPIRKLPIP